MRTLPRLLLSATLVVAPAAALASSTEAAVSAEEAQDIAKNAGIDAVRSVEYDNGYWIVTGTNSAGQDIRVQVDATTGASASQ
jgi:uncharacterized protein YpmB